MASSKISRVIPDPTTKGFLYRESDHTYWYDGKRMTGVTSMLNKVLAKPALIQWAANMAVDYIKKTAKEETTPLGNKMWPVGEVILEEARTAHAKIRDTAGDLGKSVHKAIEDYVKLMIADQDGKPLGINGNEDKHLQTFIDWAQTNNVTFIASEAVFYSPNLFLAGTADLVFEMDGVRCIGDIKIKNKIYGREAFLQMAAYHMLSESMDNPKGERSVILRIDPKTAELEELWSKNTTPDREAFLNVLYLYRYLFN